MKDKERMFQMGHVGSEQRLRDENVDSGLRSENIRESNQSISFSVVKISASSM